MNNILKKVFLYTFILLSTALNIVMAIKLYDFSFTKDINEDRKNNNVVKDNLVETYEKRRELTMLIQKAIDG